MTDWVRKGMISFSIATSKVEKELLNQRSEELDRNRESMVSPYHRNQLAEDLVNGQLTTRVQEFRKQHYMLLRESEKYNFKWGKDGDFELLTESEVKARRNGKGDPYDSYDVEVTVDNKSISSGILESSTVRPIKIQRGVFPKYRIEEYTDTVLIRDIDGKNKLVEFYIPKNQYQDQTLLKEIELLKTNPKVNDFVNITNLNFTTPGGAGMRFSYKFLALSKVVEYNGNYIVKMFAEQTEDPRWIGEDFMLTD